MSKTVMILDGHSLMYACYYAIRGLTAPSGEPTNATSGVTAIVFKLLREKKPDALVAVFDPPGGSSFRNAIYKEYKANRPPMPEDLRPQGPRIQQVLTAMGLPVIMHDGIEADDIIATIARRSASQGYDVVICSKDKDLQQLLCDNIRLYDTSKDLFIDVAALAAEKQITPAQMIDFLAMMGDTADNVPGIPGVGPKTAATLINQYGNIDGVLKAAKLGQKLPTKVAQFLAEPDGEAKLRLSQQLVTLKDDIDLAVTPENWRPEIKDRAALAALLTELGLTRLAEQMGLTKDKPTATANLTSAASPKVAPPTKPIAPPPKPAAKSKSAPLPGQGLLFGAMDAEEEALAAEAVASHAHAEAMLDEESLSPAEAAAVEPIIEPAAPPIDAIAPATFLQIKTLDQLRTIVDQLALADELSVDTETTSTDPMLGDLVGVSLCADESLAYYVPIRTCDEQHLPREDALAILKTLLENPRIKKLGQNIKYDLIVLRNVGIDVANVVDDSMIASYLLNPASRHNMDDLAVEHLGYRTIHIDELIGTGKHQLTLDQVATSRVSDYSAEDAFVALALCHRLRPKIAEANLAHLYNDVEMPLVETLAAMESRGVAVDTERLSGLSARLAERIDGLTIQIHEHAGRPFNIDSPKQLAEILFDDLKLPVVKKTKTGRSTDVDVLEELAWKHPVPKMLLEYRQLTKLKSTYVDRLPEMICPRTGRIHTSFNQTVTATGRLSSSNPNLQNIPIRSDVGKEIRAAFVPGDRARNVLLTCDYSQIELRLLAHFSHDANMMKAFRENLDIHAFVAGEVFHVPIDDVTSDQRRVAKTVNFGIVYGQTAHGLAGTLGIGRREAQTYIDAYFARYAGVKTFIDSCIASAKEHGCATTILGRRRTIPELASQNPGMRSFGERLAVNTVVQGSAADLIKVAMVQLHRQHRAGTLPAEMLVQVHDELVFEVAREHADDVAQRVVAIMTSAIPLDVPLAVDAAWGDNWLEGK